MEQINLVNLVLQFLQVNSSVEQWLHLNEKNGFRLDLEKKREMEIFFSQIIISSRSIRISWFFIHCSIGSVSFIGMLYLCSGHSSWHPSPCWSFICCWIRNICSWWWRIFISFFLCSLNNRLKIVFRRTFRCPMIRSTQSTWNFFQWWNCFFNDFLFILFRILNCTNLLSNHWKIIICLNRSLLGMNCIWISSSTLVVDVFIPGGSFVALPNLFHFYKFWWTKLCLFQSTENLSFTFLSATIGKTCNFSLR